MLRYLVVLFSFILLVSCAETKTANSLQKGIWRAELEVQDNKILPFTFEVNEDKTLTIFNAEERILVDEIEINGDSITIKAPVFEGYLAGIFTDDTTIKGDFVKESLDRIVPFTMSYGKTDRFAISKNQMADLTGVWETVFSPNVEEDRYIAKGIFKQEKSGIVTGTFRTTTGDYRYLEGVLDGNELSLSAFDGGHAFLFTATVTDSTMTGTFYSGNHFQEPFVAKRNANYELPSDYSLTFLKEGYDKFEFSFPDVNGKMISLEDNRFKDKVVLVQILGSWCPNCLDETKFYAPFYKENKERGFEIVGLNFEYAKTKEKAIKSMNRLADKIGVEYPLLLAQYGTSDKEEAAKKLPMLNHVLSYPTTIYIDKKGNVRKIHTGYNGPATGEKHLEFKKEFTAFIGELIAE
ncbi:TlpA disulfide reductase family protein [Spongiivirga sp. MCCC 1A20706]|uniref:peroxiredoxin family protein n=1 Tax=Spongiivirga sp. MCCC 1A20706 TaxID=3160963 RepID=UPI0039777DB1